MKGENQTSVALLGMDPQVIYPRPAEGNGIRSELMCLGLVYNAERKPMSPCE